MTPDHINGLFELIGGLLIWANVVRLARDRQIRGVDWRVTGFFWAWGLWNLFYYPHLGQWWSFAGGLMIVVANCAWLALAWRYRHREHDISGECWCKPVIEYEDAETGIRVYSHNETRNWP